MLNNLSIKFRMLFYIVLTVIVFISIGYLSQVSLNQDNDNLNRTTNNLELITASSGVSSVIYREFTQLLLDIELGALKWEESKFIIDASTERVQKNFSTFNSVIPESEKQSGKVLNLLDAQEKILDSFATLSTFLTNYKGKEDLQTINNFARVSMLSHVEKLAVSMNEITDEKINNIRQDGGNAVIESQKIVEYTTLLQIIGAIVVSLFGMILMKSITKPTNNLTQVIKRLSDGESDARSIVYGSDEVAELSTAFNELLEDRAVTNQKIEVEHRELNDSVFSLLQAVAELSERDLTIRANVTEDATGPVADALNLLAEETADTLKKVKNVASDVNNASQKVANHLSSVNEYAMKEQQGAIETADQMNRMLERLDSIATTATQTNSMADTASASTKLAHQSVTDTLTGMSDIRSTVQETGKRIKQLGERSQEISHVIDIINTIAERTTVLALNASMQAVKAGEAGKGFSVIAEEIQRLAESSRESTGQISTLVNNIQQETNMTIDTMEKTIEQVVGGSTKAEDAAKQMQSALDSTNELVEAVDKIAVASLDQVNISKDLKFKAESILESSKDTGRELLSLTGLSKNMSTYAQQLVTSVNVFTLEKDKENIPDRETI